MSGGTLLLVLFLGGVCVQGFSLLDPTAGDLGNRLSAPGWALWFGSDQLGRDVFARILAGALWSISAAVMATLIAVVIGVTAALLAVELGGPVKRAVELLVNSVITLPGIVIAVVVTAVLGQGWLPIVMTLGFLSWPVITRVALTEAASIASLDFVAAARLCGQSRWRTVTLHVLPALLPTLLVVAAFHFADMLIAESALSFLGLAAPLGAPTWGNMMADARPYAFSAPWLILFPALAVVACVIAANLLANGLTAVLRRGRVQTPGLL
jgi:peptide/nickel transport system permease protein